MKKLFLTFSILLFVSFVSASPIGIEYLDDDVTFIWNQGVYKQDWYFFGNATLQLSNMVNESWEYVYYGVSWGSSISDIIDNYVEIGEYDAVNRVDTTDNLTYANVLAWKDFSIFGKDIRLAKNNYIHVNGTHMNSTYYLKSFDTINQDTYFVIHRTNITIMLDEENDFVHLVFLNGSELYINLSLHDEQNFTSVYSGTELKKILYLDDLVEEQGITFQHEYPTTDWWLVIKDREVYSIFENPPMSPGDERYLTTYWVDAKCNCAFGTADLGVFMDCDDPESCDIHKEDNYTMKCYYTFLTGDCSNDVLYWQYKIQDPFAMWQVIPGTGVQLDCTGVNCVKGNPAFATWYPQNITGEGTGEYWVRCYYSCGSWQDYSGQETSTVWHPCNRTTEWNVTRDTTCTNWDINLDGDLNIFEDELTFNNVNLTFGMTSDGDHGINNTGTIDFNGFRVTSNNTAYEYFWRNYDGSGLFLDDGNISECGWTGSTTSAGVYIETDNTSIDNVNFSNGLYGLMYQTEDDHNITNSDFHEIADRAIFTQGGVYYMLIENNTFFSAGDEAILFSGTQYSIIRNNTIDCDADTIDGVYLSGSTQYNNFSDNHIFNCINRQLFLTSDTADYNSFRNEWYEGESLTNINIRINYGDNNTFWNINGTGADSANAAVYLFGTITTNAGDNKFYNSSFDGDVYGVRFDDVSDNWFINTTLSGGTRDIRISDTGYNYILNVTHDDFIVDSGDLGRVYVLWFLDVNVTNTSSSAVNAANVSGWDDDTTLRFSELTDGTGFITTQNATEKYYWESLGVDSEYFFTNYTVNVTASGYQNFNGSYNFTTNTQLNIILQAIPAAIERHWQLSLILGLFAAAVLFGLCGWQVNTLLLKFPCYLLSAYMALIGIAAISLITTEVTLIRSIVMNNEAVFMNPFISIIIPT